MKTTFNVDNLTNLLIRARKLKKKDGTWRANIYHPTKWYPLKHLMDFYINFIYDLIKYNIEDFDPTEGAINFKAIYFSPDAYEIIRNSIHPEFQETYLPSYSLDLSFNECEIDEDNLSL